ncbi:DsbA family protein [Streptomyces sp. NPDC086091]|uniref:DsbA family protein n=1 Tax=Streptomyces sp. NPDC086091 TaxID=3365751 RepID=UPI003813B0A7
MGRVAGAEGGRVPRVRRGPGLDLDRYDADLAAPEVADRVRGDQRDGLGLGVQGTPTFFVDGARIPTPASYEEFAALIEARLAGGTG